MARPESMEAKFPIAQKYNAGLVALLWGPSGLPRDADERGVLAAELIQKAIEFGIPGEDIWMDPIVTPVTSPQSQVQVPSCVEFMKMFKDLQEVLPGMRSTCGLSNVSNGAPDHLRPILNQTYMMMLERYGMASAIVDAFDEDLKRFASGRAAGPPEIGLPGHGWGRDRSQVPEQGRGRLREDNQGPDGQNPLLGFMAGALITFQNVRIVVAVPNVPTLFKRSEPCPIKKS